MLVYTTQITLKEHLSPLKSKGKTIGLVPTMGAIHMGHLSLMQEALSQNDIVVVSIFVNPTQFNNPNDLEKYPRTLERDVKLIESLSDKIIVFAPSVEDIYADNAVADIFKYDGLENQMEGANRPGHFNGVGTIVKKLFEITEADKAYFGEKDFQQLQIIRNMTTQFKLPVEIVGVPIFRQEDGLAMSSRNELLSDEAKKEATLINQIMLQAKNLFKSKSIKEVVDFVENEFKKHSNFELEYFEIADEKTLQTAIEKTENTKYRGFVVVHLDNVRLIDNISLN
ncbi:pantoate--beta-alanine ligase [Flavobacterium sp. I3-2]|uniref:pantoate--beta-alanine ligase n=1 Tax=Flavobacterium sp. I3-2 TaxID=2748319 RepID=UPI0015A78047|nr:pantoate--beta-alanine ligase [Flavobacterium sp. I3-2]